MIKGISHYFKRVISIPAEKRDQVDDIIKRLSAQMAEPGAMEWDSAEKKRKSALRRPQRSVVFKKMGGLKQKK